MSNLTQITDKLFACREGNLNTVLSYLEPGNYKVLGTVDLESISFDVEPLLEKSFKIDGKQLYKCYKELITATEVPEESFRSLLKSKGIEPTSESKILIIEKV